MYFTASPWGIDKPKLLYSCTCDIILALVFLLAAGVIVAMRVTSGRLTGVIA